MSDDRIERVLQLPHQKPKVVAAVDLNGPNRISGSRRFAAWVLMNVPLGPLGPYVAGYVFTGRWTSGVRVR